MSSTGTKVSDTGRIGYTVVRRSAGLYDITFATAYPNSNYVYSVTPLGAFVSLVLGAETSATTISVYTFTGGKYSHRLCFFLHRLLSTSI